MKRPDPNKKRCTICKQVLGLENFHKNRSKHDGLATECKICVNEKSRLRRLNKPTPAEYYRDWRAKNPEASRAIVKNYVSKNKDKRTALSNKRRAAELQAIPKWVDIKEIELIYSKSAEMSKSANIKYHVDHIVPLLSKLVCGLHSVENLRIIPAKENHSKRNYYWPDMPD